MIGPRHTTFERDPGAAALQAGENARDTLDDLRRKLTGHWAIIGRYRASGNPQTRIAVGVGDMPIAVVLVRAVLVNQPPGSTVAIQGSADFVWDGASRTVYTYEPIGLIAGEAYQLTYLIGESE